MSSFADIVVGSCCGLHNAGKLENEMINEKKKKLLSNWRGATLDGLCESRQEVNSQHDQAVETVHVVGCEYWRRQIRYKTEVNCIFCICLILSVGKP